MSGQLEATNSGLPSPSECGRLSHSLCGSPSSVHGTSLLPTGGSGGHSDRGGDTEYAGQRSHIHGTTSGQAICQPSVSGPEERWFPETGNKLEKVEPVCGVPTLQDGGSPSFEGFNPTGGFHDKGGLKGRLLQCSSVSGTPEIPQVQVAGKTVSVPLSTVWPGTCSEDFHQGNETGDSIPPSSGCTSDRIFRRHDYYESEQGRITEGSQLPSALAHALRVCDQLEEILPESDPDLGFLGFYSQHSVNDFGSTNRQSGQNYQEMSEINDCTHSVSEGVGRDGGFVNLISESHPPCTFALQTYANDTDQSPIVRQVLRDKSEFTTSDCERPEMVDRQHCVTEWQSHYDSVPRHNNRDRCIPQWLGGSLGRPSDRGSVESGRAVPSHQCVGAEGSSLRGEIFHHRQERHTCPSVDGQRFCSNVHPEDGWYKVAETSQGGSGAMGFLPGEEDPLVCRVSSRSPERPSRLGIQAQLGLKRLDVRSKPVQDTEQEMGSSTDRPVCHSSQHSVGQVCELASRPLCGVSGCFSESMDQSGGVSIPSFLHDSSLPIQGHQGHGYSGNRDTGLAVPIVVPHSVGTGNRLSGATASDKGLTKVPSRRATSSNRRQQPTVGGMENIRAQAVARGISQEAASLLAEHSWRKGTTSAYESAWGQWSRWCHPQQVDPFRAPVECIVNYLTERFTRGDKYNTLNGHRSAISAFHVPVDGVKVGQHREVTGIMSAFFNARPPLPRYECTWDVDGVLNYLLSLGDNRLLALKQLTYKLTMLLALSCAGRSSDLCALDLRYMKLEEDRIIFHLAKLTKSRRKGKPPIKLDFLKFADQPALCVLSTINVYLDRTKHFRSRKDKFARNQLLLSFVEPHHAVVPCTIAGWLLRVMAGSGVDTDQFKAHSTRGASTSKAAALGLSCMEILKMAKWKRKSTFLKHYHKSIVPFEGEKASKFGAVVLST